jgi:RNA polymerase sigma factor (sigma-70 family)
MIPTDPASLRPRPQLRTVVAIEGSPEFDRRAPARVLDGAVARAGSPSDPATPVRSLQTDEQLVALVRCGHQGAFDTLAARYQRRLLSFCLQMLRSKEDAEDALQDVFASAYSAIVADEREIQVRPWLYRIARNRCLNQLRRTAPVAIDSMDEHSAENGRTLVEKVVSRQELRELLGDVQALPDTQRTALLLREIDGFAYAHIAVALDTTVPGVKSLLVRARLGLLDSAAVRETVPPAPTHRRTGKRARQRRGARIVSYPTALAAATVARGAAA